jgi:Bacteriocin-protection, YdeI or OmpD-Associated/Domain of unknown function (DUF1905)
MRFRTSILQNEGTATGIRIPDDVMAALNAGKKPPISVTINGGHTYRSTVATVNGLPMVGLSAENRAAAGVEGGDEVDVDVELDTAPRTVAVPPELEAALSREPDARRFFDSLSYSQQHWHTSQVEGTSNPETKARRVEKSIAMLREGRKP